MKINVDENVCYSSQNLKVLTIFMDIFWQCNSIKKKQEYICQPN